MRVGSALRGYRAYYALGGTVGMFGTPVSMSQWRLINGVGAVIILIGAVPPVAAIPLWQCRQARLVVLALCWVVAVGCVMHALVNGTARILSLAGILHMDFPFFASIDRRESDLQDLLLNEPWFLMEGLLWGALGWFGLESARSRRLWVASGLVATAAPRMPDERRPTNWPPIEVITPPISREALHNAA
jgi:hypothetical protein